MRFRSRAAGFRSKPAGCGAALQAACAERGLSLGIALAEGQTMLAAQTDDASEGLAAFNERRRPRWTKDGS